MVTGDVISDVRYSLHRALSHLSWFGSVLGLKCFSLRDAGVLTANTSIFYDVTQCSLVDVNQYFVISHKIVLNSYCDVTAESRNSKVRTRRPLLSNGSELMFPLQRIAANELLQRNKLLNTRFPLQPTGQQRNCSTWCLLCKPCGIRGVGRSK
jgi:hypothetical protein